MDLKNGLDRRKLSTVKNILSIEGLRNVFVTIEVRNHTICLSDRYSYSERRNCEI